MGNPSLEETGDPFHGISASAGLTAAEREIMKTSVARGFPPKRCDGGDVLLFSENDSLALFYFRHLENGTTPTDQYLNPAFYRGEGVLVVPGYGTLPLWLETLGAGAVCAVDKDPATIAWQKARQFYSMDWEFEQSAYELVTTGKHFGITSRESLMRLHESIQNKEPRREPHCPNVSFVEGDICGSLPVHPGGYKLIVVPFLIGFPNGLQEDRSWKIAIDNLLTYLKPGGVICITPAVIAPCREPRDGQIEFLAGMERFGRYLQKRPDIKAVFGPEHMSINSIQMAARTRYALIAPAAEAADLFIAE